ncbi:PREDICTED: uncharacterized protein LOC107185918 [Dufourea novaeangliae]|uniref:uncharacterized protein LOC107185918 n=1 Tax=Dufourea novaeangliae TaxID=178035 RepID=UPI0007672DFA|nr:PREDICTED: uncharacterized protein LOC107185918 [Dufourea novaeangliae]
MASFMSVVYLDARLCLDSDSISCLRNLQRTRKSLEKLGFVIHNDKKSERTYHINCLELVAAFFGFKCFANNLSKCEILLRIDNTTAVSYINRMGEIQYSRVNDITRNIWKWCEEREIWLCASYITSKENVEADRGSRVKNIDTEWDLSNTAFSQIVKAFGTPSIDLFAPRCNSKCNDYCSWHRDPEALAVDAFTLNWKHVNFYAFPPFSMILKVLRKIIQDQAQGILVFPKWCEWFLFVATIQ